VTTDAHHRLAAQQHGAITPAQAEAAGVSASRLRTERSRGIWSSPVRGVLVAASSPSTWMRDAAVAALATGGVLSHRAAARLHGLDGIDGCTPEVSIERGRRARNSPQWIVHQVATLASQDVTVVRGLRTTSVARTLVDLGAVVDDDLVEAALDDALRRGASLRWITSTLERLDRPGPSGTASLRRVLARPDRRGRLPDSRFERLLERAIVAGGVPRPERQVTVRDAAGRPIARLDHGWPDLRLGVEAHSARWHSGPVHGRADQLRDNRLAAEGWELLYAGWYDLQHPEEFADLLGRTYRRRCALMHVAAGRSPRTDAVHAD
jgi:hypothetical protein